MAETEYTAEAQSSGGEADGLFKQLKGWYDYDIAHVNKWRAGDKEGDGGAKEDWDFYNNRQWSDDDANALKGKNRPIITWNRVSPLVNAVVGSEINNRREVRYFPREQGDAIANEVLTAAGEWFRDECGAEDEESDAWKSTVVCGMGWTDTRLDFETNPDGDPRVEDMDCFEMVWDCNAVKPNLYDAQRMFRVRELSYDEAYELTGEKDRKKLHAAWVKSGNEPSKAHDQDKSDKYDGTQSEDYSSSYKKCCVVEARWLEKETFYRGPDPQDPAKPKEYSEEQFKAANKLHKERTGQDFPAVKQARKVVRRAFIGSEVLGKPDRPMVPAGMFGWECITGYKDKNENQWYGIVRVAKDPARWANKFFSQVQFLLNSQSKGGILAERGAFENDRQAEASWAKSDAITWAQSGALSGEKPKIMPKSPAQFPAGFFTLFQESKEAISDVTGLSQEFIGTREVDQAGVLEYQRRQSSLNLLAELFNSLRRYRKRNGKTVLYLIQEHLADGRLIRIVGDDLAQYVPLMKQEGIDKAKAEAMQQAPQQAQQLAQQGIQQGVPPDQALQEAMQMVTQQIEQKFGAMKPVDGEYDIIVDDSPTSPNEKDRTWQILMQMLPMVKDLLGPGEVLELLGSSPLPASLVEKWKKKAEEKAKQPPPPTPEEMKMQAIQQKAQLDAQGQQQDLQAKAAETQMNLQAQQQSNAMDQQSKAIDAFYAEQEARLKIFVAEQKAQSDVRNLAIKEQSNKIAAKRANTQRTQAASK